MTTRALNKALANTPEPTPGYLYHDMAQLTCSDYNAHRKIVRILFNALRSSASVHVLYKALRMIRVLCETGHVSFQHDVQQTHHTEILRSLASYRGQPHPIHGDAYNERVRSEAHAAIHAAFAARSVNTAEPCAMQGQGSGDLSTSRAAALTAVTATGAPTYRTGGSSSPLSGAPSTACRGEHVGRLGQGGTWLTRGSSSPSRVGATTRRDGFVPIQPSLSIPRDQEASHSTARHVEQSPCCESTNTSTSRSTTTMTTSSMQPRTPVQIMQELVTNSPNAPSRVQLTAFVQDCLLAAHASDCPGGLWQDLCIALEDELQPSRSWQRRLAALACVEALLHIRGDTAATLAQHMAAHRGTHRYHEARLSHAIGSSSSSSKSPNEYISAAGASEMGSLFASSPAANTLHAPEGDDMSIARALIQNVMSAVGQYFTAHDSRIQRNAGVVQHRLKERAQAVLRLLHLDEDTVAARRLPPPEKSSTIAQPPTPRARVTSPTAHPAKETHTSTVISSVLDDLLMPVQNRTDTTDHTAMDLSLLLASEAPPRASDANDTAEEEEEEDGLNLDGLTLRTVARRRPAASDRSDAQGLPDSRAGTTNVHAARRSHDSRPAAPRATAPPHARTLDELFEDVREGPCATVQEPCARGRRNESAPLTSVGLFGQMFSESNSVSGDRPSHVVTVLPHDEGVCRTSMACTTSDCNNWSNLNAVGMSDEQREKVPPPQQQQPSDQNMAATPTSNMVHSMYEQLNGMIRSNM